MRIHLVCWRCGKSLQHIPQPLTRLAQCPACNADLHVCRLCYFYDPKLSGHCNHELAEPARETDIANFCDYFRANPDAYTSPETSKHQQALAQFQELFSQNLSAAKESPSAEPTEAKSKFDALFKDIK